MVVGTRSTPAAVATGNLSPLELLERVLDEVFGFAAGVPVRLALEEAGVVSITDLLTLASEDITMLRYSPGAGTTPTSALKALEIAKLRKIAPFHAELCRRKGGIPSLLEDHWLTTRASEWDEFRTNPELFARASTTGGVPGTPSLRQNPSPTIGTIGQSTTVQSATTSLRDSFARAIKKDPESYPAFKEARFWDTWNRELISKAHLHEISDVLNPSFIPATNEEAQLFELQKKFLYAVFLSKVTVADGINIVKQEKDAQKCYQALVFRFEQSAEATMDAQSIREKIQDLKLDKSWRSSATKFINFYESQVILLESLTVDRALLWHEKTKITMLASAVKSNKDLATIMSQDNLDVAKGRVAMTYEQYIALLKFKAHELDGAEKIKRRMFYALSDH